MNGDTGKRCYFTTLLQAAGWPCADRKRCYLVAGSSVPAGNQNHRAVASQSHTITPLLSFQNGTAERFSNPASRSLFKPILNPIFCFFRPSVTTGARRSGQSSTHYRSKWRNTWIRDVFCYRLSQHLWCRLSQSKLEFSIRKFTPPFHSRLGFQALLFCPGLD